MERHLCSWTAKIKSIKISKLPNAPDPIQPLSKSQKVFLERKLILELMNSKQPQRAKLILKMNKAGD